jgi:hypothetical protein
VPNGQPVRLCIFGWHVTPVAGNVTSEKRVGHNAVMFEMGKHATRGNDLPEPKLGPRRLVLAVGSQTVAGHKPLLNGKSPPPEDTSSVNAKSQSLAALAFDATGTGNNGFWQDYLPAPALVFIAWMPIAQ